MIKDLTQGSIIKNLLKVSVPVMGASLFQMAYQIIDMFFLGNHSSNSVAAVGTASFYIGIATALSTLVFIGTGIRVSHSVGEKNIKKSMEYVIASIVLTFILTLFISVLILSLKYDLINYFKIESSYIVTNSISYLTIVVIFSIFKNLSLTFNRIFIGFGSGKIPLIIESVSLVINIILDPVFIFTLNLGVKGAAIATVISQGLAAIAYVIIFIKNSKILTYTKLCVRVDYMVDIIKTSYPVAIQRVVFAIISIFMGKIISYWGTDSIAVQKIGLQLESLSWVTSAGMQDAMVAFTGQNFGAKKYERLKKGYFTGVIIMGIVGALVTCTFLFLPEPIFSLFVKEESVISGGVSYLKILAISQLFMCIEITTMGAFYGVGKTWIPPLVSISLTASRIPISLLLSSATNLGVTGVWLTISLSTVIKGIILTTLFIIFLKKNVISSSE